MAEDFINKKTRNEFREYLVGWTLREIEMEFDAADIICDSDYIPPTSGARRSLVEQYYHTIDFKNWKQVQRLLKVYEYILINLEKLITSDDTWVDSGLAKRQFDSLIHP